MKTRLLILLFFCVVGVLDSGYLTYEHFWGVASPCQANPWMGDCGTVLKSEYSVILGIPLASIGVLHYSLLSGLAVSAIFISQKYLRFTFIAGTIWGLIASLWFVFLQLFVIGAICIFCMLSAINSVILFILTLYFLRSEWREGLILMLAFLYQHSIKRILFLFPATQVHEYMVKFGEILGTQTLIQQALARIFTQKKHALVQKVAGVTFPSPIGLAAGFDYEARLTQILPSLGFGFQTIGTITNHPYEGNSGAMLGRLPRSQSLMVNKGFKNAGAHQTIAKLQNKTLCIPVGISIGRTNTDHLTTHKACIQDIVECFRAFECSPLRHAYYELNISCPNLKGNVDFYEPKRLDQLLKAVDMLQLTKPVFVKMPIDKPDQEVLPLLHVIAKHSPAGVIFGNLQKNRKDPALDPQEVAKFPQGGFSGKPTFNRSNQLISLTYTNFKKRFVIIGCGGVFSAEDAYLKIRLGASLVQLITGLIYKGPQLVAEIQTELPEMLTKDGFENISMAVGSAHQDQGIIGE